MKGYLQLPENTPPARKTAGLSQRMAANRDVDIMPPET